MNAAQLLQRYAQGERDFSGADLRGCNFKGQDLSGADFSGADIRGASFEGARLQGAIFSRVKAGLQKHWMVGQYILVLLLAVVAGYLQGYLGWFLAASLRVVRDFQNLQSLISIAITLAFLLVVTMTYGAIAQQGFTRKAAVFIGVMVVIVTAVAVAVAVSGAGAIAVAIAGLIAVTGVVAVARGGIGPGAGVAAGVVAGVIALVIAGGGAIATVGAGTSTIFSFILGMYAARQAQRHQPKFLGIRTLGLWLNGLGGTRFYRADLTDANFSKAILKSVNFRDASLHRVCWKDAQHLDSAQLGTSILQDLRVQKLLINLNGYRQSYEGIDLSNTNLEGANLEEANLKRTNLSHANCRNANLKNANLAKSICLGTDFQRAYLTGACLQSWSIDHSTDLDQVDCQYVFLLERPNEDGDRERRPHDPEKLFQPGDFEKLYRKIMKTVELLLRGGVSSEAFHAAFEKLMDNNPGITPNSIRAMERVGNDIKLTLDVPEEADKGKIERLWDEVYTARLEAAKTAALLEAEKRHADDLKDIHVTTVSSLSNLLSNLTINTYATSQSESHAMNNSPDSSRKIEIGNIGGDFNASGSALNLGDISGTVTNTINQLPDSPSGETGLKELLAQLQAVLESADPQLLSPDDKADALEQVKLLAEAAQAPEPEKQAKASKAKRFLQRIVDAIPTSVPIATTLLTQINQLMPQIILLLGL